MEDSPNELYLLFINFNINFLPPLNESEMLKVRIMHKMLLDLVVQKIDKNLYLIMNTSLG